MNRVTVTARVLGDPHVSLEAGGELAAHFFAMLHAPAPGVPDPGSAVPARTEFAVRCNVWGPQSVHLVDALEPGTMVLLSGLLVSRDRGPGTAVELDVEVVGPSLDDAPPPPRRPR